MPGRGASIEYLTEQARTGDPGAVARLLSLVEDASPRVAQIAAALAPHTGAAHVVGLTGAPGVGKSTVTAALVGALRRREVTVAVLAVDPTSPLTGGALLGDRVRMQHHATDPGVFIRSMANRGKLGGLAWSTPQAIRVLDAAGYDVVLVETVGVGQSEVEIAAQADTTLVLLAPGTGDAVQVAKAGLLEIADVFVVNKADREGAAQTRRELSSMLRLAAPPDRSSRSSVESPESASASWQPTGWSVPIVMAVGTLGEGVPELLEQILRHGEWLDRSRERGRRRLRRARDEIETIALTRWRARLGEISTAGSVDGLAAEVVAGRTDPFRAADLLVGEVDPPRPG